MQTFLPEFTFQKSAQVLDNKRLGKQRVEALQILEALQFNTGWANHPAVKMWRGYEYELCNYGIAICNEWIKRGYKDSLLAYFEYNRKLYIIDEILIEWYNHKLVNSHRSNLLRKDYEHYKQFNWTVPDNLRYWWPIE